MMREEKIALLEEVAARVEGRVDATYSGRGMFGATCYGIRCDDATDCIEEAAAAGIKGARADNMGRGFIVYWPSIEGEQYK